MAGKVVDQRYYQVAKPGTFAERLVVVARDTIYADFLRLAKPTPSSSILDVGVSDVVGEAANVLERKYPYLHQITAVGLGEAQEFQTAFPQVAYRQINPGESLPFADNSFDIATSNAVLEHVGSPRAQAALVSELARVARMAFITVPHRFFPVEHHTAIPFLHWTNTSFALACAMLGKSDWAEPTQLILMTKPRLRATAQNLGGNRKLSLGMTGIALGPFSSNLYLLIRSADIPA
jgi:hypothetical protein